MGGLYLAVDARIRRDDQRARLLGQRTDVAPDHAVDPQAAAENHVALDARRRADQAVDAVLRLARLVKHLLLPFPLLNSPLVLQHSHSPCGLRVAGYARPISAAPVIPRPLL